MVKKVKVAKISSSLIALMLILGACSNDSDDNNPKESNDKKMEENMDGMDDKNMDMDSKDN